MSNQCCVRANAQPKRPYLFKDASSTMTTKMQDQANRRGLFFAKGDLYSFDPRMVSAHGSSLAALPEGGLYATWFGGSREGARDVAIYGAKKPPGGPSWSAPFLVHDTPGQSDGNSALWFDPRRERLWLYFVTLVGENWHEAIVKRKVSTDEGKSWYDPMVMCKQSGWMVGEALLELSNGNLLLPLHDEGGLTGSAWSSMVYLSSDRGETWERFPKHQLRSPRGSIQPNVVELDTSGYLLMFMRTQDAYIYKSESRDFGRTWSAAEKTDLPSNNARFALIKLRSGALALAYNPVAEDWGARTPLRLALSHDRGRTWPVYKDIEVGPGEYSYPWLLEAPDGLLYVSYTYRRTRIRCAALTEAWLMSDLEAPVLAQPATDEEALAQFRAGEGFLPWSIDEEHERRN